MSLYEVIGRNEPDYLLYDPNGAERIAVPMEPGAGTVNRGTVCYRKESGMYAAAAAAQAVGTNYLVVLDETVDTGDGDTAVAATAFRSGKLVKGKVTLAAGAELSDAAALVLRQQGIVLAPMAGESNT
ncbi:MAG: hypothetical protein J6K72_08460 [Clostridia bacterium]|nr:hypothetical protein [Clostridia bacterium]